MNDRKYLRWKGANGKPLAQSEQDKQNVGKMDVEEEKNSMGREETEEPNKRYGIVWTCFTFSDATL